MLAHPICGALREKITETARILQIEAPLARKAGQLSGGQRQRAALGRAMDRNPVAFLLPDPAGPFRGTVRHCENLGSDVFLRLRLTGMGQNVILCTEPDAATRIGDTQAFTAIPALMAFGIFSVVAHWNDDFWPGIVITGNRDLFTPPLGLREFKGDAGGDNSGPMMATACGIVTPLIVAFPLAQCRFIEGITLSGMK